MEKKSDYEKVMTDIIQKQIVILGPDIALLKVKDVPNINVNEKGEVVEIKGNSRDALQKLVESYVSLSGQIFKSVITPLLKKYPDMVVNII